MDPSGQQITEIVLRTAAGKVLELGFDKIKSVLGRVKTELSTPQFEIERRSQIIAHTLSAGQMTFLSLRQL